MIFRRSEITLRAVCSAALVATMVLTPLTAEATSATSARMNTPTADNVIYVNDDIASAPVLRRTRGNCTDVYSAAWCNAHGYGNNRPVPARVKLNAREKSCVIKVYGSLAAAVAKGVVQGAASGYYAAARAVYNFWRCAL